MTHHSVCNENLVACLRHRHCLESSFTILHNGTGRTLSHSRFVSFLFFSLIGTTVSRLNTYQIYDNYIAYHNFLSIPVEMVVFVDATRNAQLDEMNNMIS